ncbi:MAG: DUF4124 domain-containing protein [Halomonas sp.]|nr:DUF4124 domain-containing protein [Halomonas sp.]MBR2512761.1 DUF4124 domain-containing protein [Halomonas sp.]
MQGLKAAVLLAVVVLPAVAQGQIFKCVDEAGRVGYQDTNCPMGIEEILFSYRLGRLEAPWERSVSDVNEDQEAEVLAQLRLSRVTPFLESNDGNWESAVNAPRLDPGTVIFITGIEGAGNDAWFAAFRVVNDERDFGVINSVAIMGQDESLPLIDWPNALAKTDQAKTAAAMSDNFSALPGYDIEAYCDDYASGMEELGVEPDSARERCLSAEHDAQNALSTQYQELPFIISQTCTIESLASSEGSYEDLQRCVEIKEMFSGDALTFPG